MDIPKYVISAIYTHYKRIAEHCTCDPKDHRTRDALRQSKKELLKLEKLIKDEKETKRNPQ